MSSITVRFLFIVFVLRSSIAADTYKVNDHNEHDNKIVSNGEPNADESERSYEHPNPLQDTVPDISKLDRYYRYKTLKSVSPFESSSLEIRPLEEVSEHKEGTGKSKYVFTNTIEQNIFKDSNLNDDSNKTELKNTTEVNEILSLIKESNAQTGIESKAEAFLSVNNVTIEQFYENRVIKSDQYESNINELLYNNLGNTNESVKLSNINSNENIRNKGADANTPSLNILTIPDIIQQNAEPSLESTLDSNNVVEQSLSTFDTNITSSFNNNNGDDTFNEVPEIYNPENNTYFKQNETMPSDAKANESDITNKFKTEDNPHIIVEELPNKSGNNFTENMEINGENISAEDITTQYVPNLSVIDENPNSRKSEKPYVLQVSSDSEEDQENDDMSLLRSDIYGSLDDIAQKLIRKPGFAKSENFKNNREELEIINITGIVDFGIGEGIQSWKSINLWHKNYIIGIGDTEMTLVESSTKSNDVIQYKILDSIPTTKLPSSFDVFRIRFENSVQLGAVLSLDNQIMWYKITPEKQLMHIWSWLLHSNINFVKVVQINRVEYLFTLENFGDTEFAAHLYEFSIERKAFWLRQRIVLECEAKVADFNFVADLIYLAIPQEQNNIVIIYKFVDGRFLPYQHIESSLVNFVSSFSVGHKNFLAIGGLDHAIYRVDFQGIHTEAILDSTFDNVQFYLPIHIRNYRDDLIVLVQHEIDHDSHSSIHVEALIWTENGFVTSAHEICDDHGQISHGFQCLLGIETDTGLIGSVVINHGKQLHIITPRSYINSEAYEIKTRLLQYSDPRREELDHFYKIQDALENNFKRQSQILLDSKIALENSLNIYEDALVKTKWYVKELETPVYRQENDMQWANGFVSVANVKFTKDDTTIHIPTLVEESGRILGSVLDLPLLMKDAVKKKDSNIKLAENLTITGELKVEGAWKAESLCVTDINGESFQDLFNRLMYDKQTVKYNGAIQFDKVYVDNLFVDFVNDQPFSNILYKSPKTIVQGSLNFFEDIQFDHVYLTNGGTINKIQFDKILRADNKINYLSLDVVNALTNFKVRKINGFIIDEKELLDATNARQQRDINDVKEIRVVGDISTETINGMNWKKFISKLVWKNAPKVLKNKMIVDGNILCSQPCLLHMPIINGLSFPSDFVLTGLSNINNFTDIEVPPNQYVIVPHAQENYGDAIKLGIFAGERTSSDDTSESDFKNSDTILESYFITGQKVFKNLNVKNLDCPGLVNGINTEDVVTLQGDQKIRGLTTFENLKVTEGLYVGGSLTGKYLDNFSANPTLKDTNVIHSSVIFKHLEVQGPVYITYVNKSSLADSLNDVVYTNEEDVVIRGYKYFENSLTIQENLKLSSNRVNGIDTVTLMTKNTEQILSMQNLNGDITFKDLTLSGFVDEVNITDLFVNTVKLQGDQYISADITFTGQVNFANANIHNLFDKPAEELITIDEPVYLNADAEFEELVVDNLFAEEVFVESNNLCNLNLIDLQSKCLSLTKPQYISADYNIDFVKANNATSFNIDVAPPDVYLRKRRNITQELILDNSEIEELIVDGKIFTNKINGLNFTDIASNAIWLNKENQISGNLNLVDGFTASEIIVNGVVNGYDFNGFVEDLVTANDDINLNAPKTFLSDLVTDNIVTNKINSIDVENILTKNTEQIISAEFVINGDAIMDEAECTEYFNGLSIKEVTNFYTFEDNCHVIHGDVIFPKLTYIDSLILDNVNNVNLHTFLPSLISTADNSPVAYPINFENDVIFYSSITTGMINGANLNNFVDNLVLIDKDATITYPVVFEKDVVFAGDLNFQGDLTAGTFSGCDTEFWKKNRISIRDGAHVSGNKIFLKINSPDQSWIARNLNDHDLSTIFTLNTDQIIPHNINFDNVLVQEVCELDGTLNGKILLDEISNTLMIESDHKQIIEAETSFAYVYVRDSLEISAQINSKYNLQNVITLDSDQIIYTPGHVFENVLIPFLDVNGSVSGIDFNEWTDNALRRSANDQVITGRWYIDTANFKKNILGNNVLNNRDLHDLADEVAKQKLLLNMRDTELKDEYTSFCLDVQYLLDLSNKYLYLLKYFEETQFISGNIKSMHVYQDNIGYCLVINYGGCESTIHKWNAEHKIFKYVHSLKTGIVDDWISVQNQDGSKFVVSRSEYQSTCDISGTNIWYLEDVELKHVFKLGAGVREVLGGSDGVFYTIDRFGVKEYVLKSFDDGLQVGGTWNMYTDESTFVPQETGFDLSLSDGKRVTKLSKTVHNPDQSNYDIFGSEPVIGQSIANTEISTTECPYLPKRGNGEVEVLTVGLGPSLRQMVAVSVLENATVGGNYDFIKIYDDVMEGRLFQTLPCLRPYSLVSIHFGQGQTILAFIEDQSHIKIYDYRGIEGFSHLYTFNIPATRLTTVVLPTNKNSTSSRHFLLASGPEGLKVFEALMHGDRIQLHEKLQCQKP